jgi:NAD(P)-dependent dehydrogenase (short-subunit alcohol dehydrogenase family)
LLEGVDLVDPTATGAAIDSASRQLGALDGVVNIAGGFAWEKLQGGDIRTWDKLYNTNLRTAVNVCQASLGKLSQGARIINMSAAGATKAGTGMGAYAASKAGVAKLTEALAEEMKDRGITVNAILPSIIDTAANRADMPHAKFDDWVKPEQIADLIVFLLSDRASAITGALIPITNRA